MLVILPTSLHSSHTFVTREITERLKRGIDMIILAPGPSDVESISLAQDLGISIDRLVYTDVYKNESDILRKNDYYVI